MTSPVLSYPDSYPDDPSGPDNRRQVAIRVAVKAVPSLILQGVVPALCFLAGRSMWGLSGGVFLAVAWNGSYQGLRWVRGKPFSAILLLSLLALLLRAGVALALGSARMFFVAPIVVTAISGVIYLGSGLTARPLIARVLPELVPDTVLDASDPRAITFLRRLSVLYGLEQLLVAVISALMLMNLPTTDYVAVHAVVSWVILGLAVAGVSPFLRNDLRAMIRPAHAPPTHTSLALTR